MPLSPYEPLRRQAVVLPWVTLDERREIETGSGRGKDEGERNLSITLPPTSGNQNDNEIIEAQSWMKDAKGIVYLVATLPHPSHTPSSPSPCSIP